MKKLFWIVPAVLILVIYSVLWQTKPITHTDLAVEEVRELKKISTLVIKSASAVQIASSSVESVKNEIAFDAPQNGIHLIALKDASLPAAILAETLKSIENLKKTGSFSGGELTHEFSRQNDLSDALKEASSLQNIYAKLSIYPTELNLVLDASYRVVGAVASDKYIENKGWTGLQQIYVSEVRKVELSESQIQPEDGDAMQVFKEAMNRTIMDYPATFERLKTKKSEPVYNVHWNVHNRNYSLSTMNLSEQETLEIAEKITNQYLSMSNNGMK